MATKKAKEKIARLHRITIDFTVSLNNFVFCPYPDKLIPMSCTG